MTKIYIIFFIKPGDIFQIRYMEFIWRKLGSNGIIDGYKFNINKVLSEISKLVDKLSGKIILERQTKLILRYT